MNSLLCEAELQFGQCFLSYTVTNHSYWLNRACQSFLCSDLCEIISMILSEFEVTQPFFLYCSICVHSHSVPISTEKAGSSHKGQLLSFTTSTSSRLFLHSFLPFQKGHPSKKTQTNNKTTLICWFQNNKNTEKKEEFSSAHDFQLK